MHRPRYIPSLVIITGLLLFFQNCGGGFSPNDMTSDSSLASSGADGPSGAGTGVGNGGSGSLAGGGGSGTTPGGGSGGAISSGSTYLADPTTTGHALEVCPSGCAYATVSGAVSQAVDGDTINVHYGVYVDCTTLIQNNIVINGILSSTGQRPQMQWKDAGTCGRKGIFIVQGANTLIENLELSHAQDTGYGDNNWAGIRFDTVATAKNLKVRNVYFHDNDTGVLGGGGGAAPNVVLVESSLFEHNGRAGYAHNMYIGPQASLFVVRNSIVRHDIDDSHLMKTRAQSSIIECNTIAGLAGYNTDAIDIPQGGTVTIRNNVIEQGPNVVNPLNAFIAFAEENTDNAPHKLLVMNNYFINDYANPGVIRVDTPTDMSGWTGNTFAGTGGMLAFYNYSNSSPGFTNYPTRAAAGLPAFSDDISSLPSPQTCP